MKLLVSEKQNSVKSVFTETVEKCSVFYLFFYYKKDCISSVYYSHIRPVACIYRVIKKVCLLLNHNSITDDNF